MIRSAGVIAAGEGSRLRKGGLQLPKPLVPVSGFPLIGHVLRNFQAVGVKKVVIIFNELERDCVSWVQENFPTLGLEFIVKSTQSSFESFWRVGKKLGPGRHLISTVDAICRPDELKKMIEPEKLTKANQNVYLGVTTFVDDEKPLWVRMINRTGQIVELGTKSGDYATAGLYSVPDSIFVDEPKTEVRSLREFLKWLVSMGTPFYGVPLSKVVDVDRVEDIGVAENFMKTEL